MPHRKLKVPCIYKITNLNPKGEPVSCFRVEVVGDAAQALTGVLEKFSVPIENTYVIEYIGPRIPDDVTPSKLKAARKIIARILRREQISAAMEGP
jgi:hypothetical protein